VSARLASANRIAIIARGAQHQTRFAPKNGATLDIAT
jgi:hypothetical protein